MTSLCNLLFCNCCCILCLNAPLSPLSMLDHITQIFGLKTLVKSYLPAKDAHLRLGIDDLMRILKDILSFGEISRDIKSRYS